MGDPSLIGGAGVSVSAPTDPGVDSSLDSSDSTFGASSSSSFSSSGTSKNSHSGSDTLTTTDSKNTQ